VRGEKDIQGGSMIKPQAYLMENDEEEKRLEIKTDPAALKEQALWCGIGPGATVLDVGCGPGKTTSLLYELIQPGGEIVGVDFSEKRINYARKIYSKKQGLEFHIKDMRLPMDDIGSFDFIWIRFILEYYYNGSVDIIRNVSMNLKQGGWLCLLDLDNNSFNHWEMPKEMEIVANKCIKRMQKEYNFDIYAGRKLYSYMYDLGFEDISMNLIAHHLIYGELKAVDEFNWMKKIETFIQKVPDIFEFYQGGSEKFVNDFKIFFKDPRRFTYTPLIICKGRKPLDKRIKLSR
jgi:SAM-dependent methyltransferase